MKSRTILLTVILLVAFGCEKKEERSHWTRGSSPRPHDQEVEIALSDPFVGSVLAETLEISGLEIKFLERPPRGGRYFAFLVRTDKKSYTNSHCILASIASEFPNGEYVSPDILRVSLHAIPDGTPLKDSENLRIKIRLNAAQYDIGGHGGAKSGNKKKNIIVPNPFYDGYQGVFQYGPIIRSKHDRGITIIETESIEYRIVVNSVDPYSKKISEQDDADNPVNSPGNPKNQPND